MYLSKNEGGYTITSFEESLRKLRVKKLGMFLLHFPYPYTFVDCWREMERLYKSGRVECIGVCNCHIHHLKSIMEQCEIVPFVNQVECHPYFAQSDLLDFCQKNGIQMEAYSPFARNLPDMIYNPILTRLAIKYQKTVHQIILRWNYQRRVISLPKASSLERIRQNINIFDFQLTDLEMEDIQTLDRGFRIRYNPDTVDYTKL